MRRIALLRLLATLALGIAAPHGARAQLLAHLTFDNAGSLGLDTSGNGNNAGTLAGSVTYSSTGISGGAASFSSSGYLAFGANTSILGALGGSFSISTWVRTTQTYGSPTDQGYSGVGIVYADVPGGSNDTIPIALNGSVAGFDTGNGSFGDSTLHSTSSIATGNFVHVVVTRDIATGKKSIYINGVLEGTENGATYSAAGRNNLLIGANDVDNRYFFGLVDDFQIYSGVLTSSQVSFLYANPGLAAVPEPSTWALLLCGSGALAHVTVRLRRRACSVRQ